MIRCFSRSRMFLIVLSTPFYLNGMSQDLKKPLLSCDETIPKAPLTPFASPENSSNEQTNAYLDYSARRISYMEPTTYLVNEKSWTTRFLSLFSCCFTKQQNEEQTD